MSDVHELESRIERLEERVAKLEHKRSAGQAVLPVQTKSDSNALALAGFASLILGGAFVLRALTESQTIPRLAGAILGLTYGAFWVWRGNRVYAITAAIIAFPLIWETTVRFQIFHPLTAAIFIGAFGVLFVWKEPWVAWVGVVAAAATAFAIGPSIAMLIAISIVGVVAKKWEYAAWPAAIAANVTALILIVTPPAGAPYALVAYAALWQLLPVQSTIASLIGLGGATYLLIPNLHVLPLMWCATGLIALEFRRSIEGVIWIVAGAVLTPLAGIAALVAIFRVRRREERLVLLGVLAYSAFLGINAVVNAPLI
ncbi:MAG TPA: hypothetical protein VKU62_02295, partial [Thermoanaerobaculia bacterium]|nr:hypothetical protein [Thermoanaerobaculia bacterium]